MNCLTVSLQYSILTLAERGWSARRIARELGIHRETVGQRLREAKSTQGRPGVAAADPETADSKPAISTPGFSAGPADSKPASISTLGSPAGRQSTCAPFRSQIETGFAAGLSLQRIYQDLVRDDGFTGSYQSVKRFGQRLTAKRDLPFRRMECRPGEEMQVDFGLGAWVVAEGRRRRPHLFRCVLSHSRKGYTEAVWRQTTESFIRCLENAFRHFGGVTERVVIDNLKAGVLQADWFDPELNPKLLEFCQHYGTVLAPTKPAMPRHKGKVEAGVKYAQNNAVKGRQFTSLAEHNRFLDDWERTVADTRIHGTVRQQVLKLFLTVERPALRPLPAMFFPSFEEAPRCVHRDGYVEFAKAYYSAPPEYVGRKVWVRAESRLVRLYNQRWEQIGVHARLEAGRFATDPDHIHPHKRAEIERGAEYLLGRCQRLGPACGAWATAMYHHRGPYGIRSLQGLLHLAKDHPVHALEQVAGQALARACWRLRDLRTLLGRGDNVIQLEFLQVHPLIRDLSAYRIGFPS
jgi:transposase